MDLTNESLITNIKKIKNNMDQISELNEDKERCEQANQELMDNIINPSLIGIMNYLHLDMSGTDHIQREIYRQIKRAINETLLHEIKMMDR